MNEVTKIHLGRQAYTISVDAYHDLKTYIAAISKQVKDADVINEIEVRMSELLADHGVTGSKVILPGDVAYLKAQLGSPADFGDENVDVSEPPAEGKRLFRDTAHGVIAGVASGLAAYFGIDALLVRILFVGFVFITAGWGILLYILLWLLVPEATTPSERLQMAGRPVTVQNLKAVVEQADVKGAARRANNALAGPLNTLFNVVTKIVGIALVVFGLSALLGLVTAGTYYLARSHAWAQNNIFPIGWQENLLLDIALAIAALVGVFIILFGIAIYRRQWPIKTWITGVLVGLLLIGLATGGALAAVAYPDVHAAYIANTHTTVRSLPAFTNVSINGKMDGIDFVPSDKYMVTFSYYGHPDLNSVKTTVQNGTLLIDTSNFSWRRSCNTLCIPDTYDLNITVYAPNALQLESQLIPAVPVMPAFPAKLELQRTY